MEIHTVSLALCTHNINHANDKKNSNISLNIYSILQSKITSVLFF
jgi:hypothetical protein